MSPVNPETGERPARQEPPVTAGDLRAYRARHGIAGTVIAARLGVSQQRVNAILHSDQKPRQVSQAARERVKAAMSDIVWERDQCKQAC